MNRSGPVLLAVLLLALVALVPRTIERRETPRTLRHDDGRLRPVAEGTADDPDGRAEYEFLVTRDPRTTSIPRDMLGRTLLRTILTIPALIGPSAAWAASERPTYEQVQQWIGEYKASHRGNGGKDWDINAKTPEQIASEPDTKRLCELCGPDQRPVFPELAWEYGGSDHPWESPENAPLVYCVYTPQATPTAHWRFDEGRKRVTAHVYVLFPERDPCGTMNAKEHIEACIGGFGNLEILSDTASLGDGRDLGFSLAEVSTELRLLRPNGKSTRLALIK